MEGRIEIDNRYQKYVENKLAKLPAFMNDYYHAIKDKSMLTINSYLTKDIIFFEFIKKNYDVDINDPYDFKKVKASVIERFMNESPGEISNKLTYLYAVEDFFKFLEKDDYIEKNPCSKITPPKNKKEVKRIELSECDIVEIRRNIRNGIECKNKTEQFIMYTRNILLFDLFISTGLRKSSVISLNLDDVDFENNQIRVFEKGHKMRYLPVNKFIINEIRDYLPLRQSILNDNHTECDALFVSNRGLRMGVSSIDHFVRTVTGSIGKEMSPHKLRATCATLLIEKTGDIYLVADRLGHASVETTKRYAHLNDDMRKKAVKAMDDIIF